MTNNRLLEVCQPVWEAADIKNPNRLSKAYQAVLDKLQFDGYDKERPYSPGAVTRALRDGKAKKIEALELAFFVMVHGETQAKQKIEELLPEIQGKWPYLDVAPMVSSDPGVEGIRLALTENADAQTAVLRSAPLATSTVLYSLLSSRVASEPEKDGNKPKCVLGFMKFDDSGSLDGEAYIFYGADVPLQSNGVVKSVEPAFTNIRGTVLIEYSLEREHLPGQPKDRKGIIKVKPVTSDQTVFAGSQTYKGTYKDLDPEGANVPGQTYFEVMDTTSEPLKDLLEKNAEQLLSKMD